MRSRAVPILAPVAVLLLALGCPRDRHDGAGAAASASAAPSASAEWPKVVTVPDPSDLFDDDASLEDGSLEDTGEDTGEDVASDALDARPKVDAYEDAPLMGAKTYPDEYPIRGIRRITSAAARVRKAPKDGDIIALLPKGTEVSLVAEVFDWYRVRYTDPNTDVRRQGWIYVTTFAGPRMKSCPVGWTHHDQDGGWCDRECTKNTDCRALKGYKCSGTLCFYAAD